MLLWEEYATGNPLAYKYTSFCIKYREFALRQQRSMRQIHIAGEKLFVDFAGSTVRIIDPVTGEITQAQIFVATLGASNYTYACATARQATTDWIGAQVQTLGFISGAPRLAPSHPKPPQCMCAGSKRHRRPGPRIGQRSGLCERVRSVLRAFAGVAPGPTSPEIQQPLALRIEVEETQHVAVFGRARRVVTGTGMAGAQRSRCCRSIRARENCLAAPRSRPRLRVASKTRCQRARRRSADSSSPEPTLGRARSSSVAWAASHMK